MNIYDFVALCLEYGVHPSVAVENEEVHTAVKAKDFEAVKKAIENNF